MFNPETQKFYDKNLKEALCGFKNLNDKSEIAKSYLGYKEEVLKRELRLICKDNEALKALNVPVKYLRKLDDAFLYTAESLDEELEYLYSCLEEASDNYFVPDTKDIKKIILKESFEHTYIIIDNLITRLNLLIGE